MNWGPVVGGTSYGDGIMKKHGNFFVAFVAFRSFWLLGLYGFCLLGFSAFILSGFLGICWNFCTDNDGDISKHKKTAILLRGKRITTLLRRTRSNIKQQKQQHESQPKVLQIPVRYVNNKQHQGFNLRNNAAIILKTTRDNQTTMETKKKNPRSAVHQKGPHVRATFTALNQTDGNTKGSQSSLNEPQTNSK